MEASESGVPEIKVTGTRGLDGSGAVRALCGEELTANVFRASCTRKGGRGKVH